MVTIGEMSLDDWEEKSETKNDQDGVIFIGHNKVYYLSQTVRKSGIPIK